MQQTGSMQDILATLDDSVNTLQRQIAQTNDNDAGGSTSRTATNVPINVAPGADANVRASAEMLLRAAAQQRRLASLLPDEIARGEMLTLADQQESQAKAILNGGPALTPAHPWHSLTGTPPPRAEESFPPLGQPHSTPPPIPPTGQASSTARYGEVPLDAPGTANHVRAVLQRDSKDKFGVMIKEVRTETSHGVAVAKILESDSGDERDRLQEGDMLRSINGLEPTSMRFDDLKAYVRDCPGALHLEVQRLAAWPPPPGESSNWQDGTSAAHGVLRFSPPPNAGARAPSPDLLNAAVGELQNAASNLGEKWHGFLGAPEVAELRGRAQNTGRDLLSGFRNLMDAGRETLEEKGHALKVFGDDLKGNVERMAGELREGHRPASGGVVPHRLPGHLHPQPGMVGASAAVAATRERGTSGEAVASRCTCAGADGGGFDAPLSAGGFARSPLLESFGSSSGIATAHSQGGEQPFLPKPLVAPTGEAATGDANKHIDPDMDEATQLAIALSLSEVVGRKSPDESPLTASRGTTSLPLDQGEWGAALPVTSESNPADDNPFPSPPQEATAGAPAVDLSEAEQLALALSLSLAEAEQQEAQLAAERAMVVEAEQSAVHDAVQEAAEQVAQAMKEEEEEHRQLVQLGEELLTTTTTTGNGTGAGTGGMGSVPPNSSRGSDADADALIPGLQVHPIVSDADLLVSALGQGPPAAAPAAGLPKLVAAPPAFLPD